MLRNKISNFISTPVISLSPDDTLKSVVKAMQEKHISCIPIVDDNSPVGILTEKGVVELLANEDNSILDSNLHEVMSSPVITITEDIYVFDVLQIFINKNIRHLVVTDKNGSTTGVITLSDIINHIGGDFLVEFQTIDLFMNKVVYTVHKDMLLSDVLLEMASHSISCVIVSDRNKPVGMITERDIIKFVAEKKLLSEKIEKIMSSPVITAPENARVHEVAHLFKKKGIRRVVAVDDQGLIAGIVTQTDIMRGLESNYVKFLKTIIKEKDIELKATSQERDDFFQYLVTILDNSIDMAIVATDKDYRIVFYNDCAQKILSFTPDITIGSFVHDIHKSHNVKVDQFEKIMDKVRDTGSYSFSFTKKINTIRHHFQARVSIIRTSFQTPPRGYVYTVQDITERKQAEENFRYMAYHDILTGLPNRVAFNERLELELSHAERRQQLIGIIVIDIDKFKDVNDTYGHYSGDILLTEVAKRFSNVLRKSDTVARLGGDEFVVILPDIQSESNGIEIIEKLINTMFSPIDIKGIEYNCSISIGLAFCPTHGTSVATLLDSADKAMYEAKRIGRKNKSCNFCIHKNN